MAKPEQINDGDLRAQMEKAYQHMREGQGTEAVQVLDGDTELDPGWIAEASAFLEQQADVAVVFGRRREKAPEASLWNRLADVEWDGPAGEAHACGGDALIRVASWRSVGG